MDALIVYPENKEQLAAVKAVMKAMKVAFEQKHEVYPDYVVQGIKKSLKQVEGQKLTPFTGLKNMLHQQ
ncbi:MAG: hypothetical protein K0S09_2212 [Sphingobacteriaceae bacterium]|jgi:hypothetical protein|nr:hypothetical protein [Sphingobacteriaceae bacterium]